MTVFKFIVEYWEWFLLGFMVLNYVVKLTPCKWDDLLLDGLGSVLRSIKGKKS